MAGHQGAYVTGDNFLCHALFGVKTVRAGNHVPGEDGDQRHGRRETEPAPWQSREDGYVFALLPNGRPNAFPEIRRSGIILGATSYCRLECLISPVGL